MIIFIHGEDTFRSQKLLKEQIEEFKKKRDPSGLNVSILDGKNEKEEKIFSEITASPFLAERRLVIIKNILSNKDEKFLIRMKEEIENKTFPEINAVIFFQDEEVGKNKTTRELFDLLKKQQYVYEMNFLSDFDLRKWAEKEVVARGGKIGSAALQSLCKTCGNDSWFLNSLIDQLVAYKNSEEISVEDIGLFAEEKVEDNIFALAEAVAYGEKNKALKMIDEQRKKGVEDFYLFSMILRQFRILTQAKDFLINNPGATAEIVAKEINQKPFIIKKVWSLLKKDFSWFERAYALMTDMDFKIKSGYSNPENMLDLLVEKI